MTDDNILPKMAAYYAAQLGWKVMPTNGLLPTGLCTCGKRHSDPKDIGKHPGSMNGLKDATTDGATIYGWWNQQPLYNIAVGCAESGLFVLDIDPRNGGFDSFDKIEALIGGDFYAPGVSATVEAITGEYSLRGAKVRGRHMYFRATPGVSLNGKFKEYPGIDIKHNGYTLIMPSNHVSGVKYEWALGKAPWEIPMADPSEALMGLLVKGSGRSSGSSGAKGMVGRSEWDWINDLEWKGQKLDLQKFMEDGIDEGSRAIDIYAITCAMANKYGTTEMDRSFIETQMLRFNHEMVRPPLEVEGQGGLMTHVHNAINFVTANPKDTQSSLKAGFNGEVAAYEDRIRQQVTQMTKNMGKSTMVTTPSAGDLAAPYTSDPDDMEEYFQEGVLSNVNIAMDVDALDEEDGAAMGGRTLSDLGNGRRLVDAFGGSIRYTAGLGWFKWNAQYWKPDAEDLELRELTKRLGSLIAAESKDYEDPDARKAVNAWAKTAKANARQSAAIESAQSDPRIGVEVDHWDNNPYLLGVANGVIDLRTGQLLRGRQDLHITRRAPVSYTPGYSSQRFQNFLDEATGGDKEYQEWLQRAFGYTLTGRRDYDVMFVMYGPAGSGKNVMVESLVKCLGTKQYAFPLDSQILAQGDGKSNAADLYHWAELRGRRMIWVDELPESERLKENAVKKLTGSSEISARSPGEKPFTFESQGKLWITTNHRPIITDDAMWRRIRPIPWMNVPMNPDPTLKAYLHDPEGGLPAVLAWAVEGAMKLHASTDVDALGWCKVVADAAEMYRKNEDRLGLFLEDETELSTVSGVSLKSLNAVYKVWSDDRSERPMTQIALQRKLSDRGLQINGSGSGAMVMGRVLKNGGQTFGGPVDWAFTTRMGRD